MTWSVRAAPARTKTSPVLQPTEGSARKIEDLPKEVGVMLMSVGVLGVVLPGMAGTPAIIAGGLVLWPRTFGKLERWIQAPLPRRIIRGCGRSAATSTTSISASPTQPDVESDSTAGERREPEARGNGRGASGDAGGGRRHRGLADERRRAGPADREDAEGSRRPPDRRGDRWTPAAGSGRDSVLDPGRRGPLAPGVPWRRGFLRKRFPKVHHQSMRQITRFLDDLERRYPLDT